MSEGMTWTDGNRLVAQLGSEANLAARIAYERSRREWSQAELARQMAELDCPIPQTAISKIENPPAGGARRDVTVDEAIAFSRVFDIPVAELFLPAGEAEALQAAAVLRAAGRALTKYEHLVNELATSAVKNPELRAALDDIKRGKPVSIPAFAFPTDRSRDLGRVLRDVDEVVRRIENRAPKRRAPRNRKARA